MCPLGHVATDGYTGADTEQVVITGLKLASHAGDGLTGEHLLVAMPDLRPLSRTDPERVAAMTAWLERQTKAARTRESGGWAKANGARQGRKVAV